jgi:hypothetical protein
VFAEKQIFGYNYRLREFDHSLAYEAGSGKGKGRFRSRSYRLLGFRSGNVPVTRADNARLLKFANFGVATANAMEDFNGMLA